VQTLCIQHKSGTVATVTRSLCVTLVHLVEVDTVDSPFPNALIAAVYVCTFGVTVGAIVCMSASVLSANCH
jgi:tetrahydromethanopterin S-methyltransferase subunit E